MNVVTNVYIFMYAPIRVYVCIAACMFMNSHMYVYRIYACVYAFTYMYMRICMQLHLLCAYIYILCVCKCVVVCKMRACISEYI